MKKITCIFRYDDYTATSPLEIEKKLFSLFRKYERQITVGVVPHITAGDYHDPQVTDFVEFTEDKINFLKECIQNNTVDAALHGFYHRSNRLGSLHSEFALADPEEQCDKIKQGKALLEAKFGAKVRVFIPPWNTYDQHTLRCLDKNNIDCISANRYGLYDAGLQLSYLPITIEFNELNAALEKARTSDDEQPLIGILLHPYDFEGSGDKRASIRWDDFEENLKRLCAADDVQVVSIARALEDNSISLDAARYKANHPSAVESVYPPFIPTTYDEPLYHSQRKARNINRKKKMMASVFYSVLAVLFFLTGLFAKKILFSDWPIVATGISYASLFVFLVIAGKSVYKKELYFKSMSLLLTSLSFFTGMNV